MNTPWHSEGRDILSGERLMATVWHEVEEPEELAHQIVRAVNLIDVALSLLQAENDLLDFYAEHDDSPRPPPDLMVQFTYFTEAFGKLMKGEPA